MKLCDLWLRNFMRFRRAHVQLRDVGQMLIEGVNRDDESASSNGAGKSTIVDALVWCLYGVTTHEPSAQGNEVVNELRKINCEVKLSLLIGDQLWTIVRRRAWKKGGKAVQLQLHRMNPDAESFDHTKGTVRDTQAAIDKLVGMSMATFRHACVFGQGRAYRFSRLTDSEKKAVLDEMLGSEIYAKASQTAADQLIQGERELDKAQTSLETALDSLKDARKRLDKLRARAVDAKRVARSRRDKLEHELKLVVKELKRIEVPKDRDAALAIAEKNMRDAETTWRKAMTAADASRVTLKQLESRRAKISSLRHTECVTCGQEIDEKHTKRQLDAIDEQIEMQGAKDHTANESLIDAKQRYDERKEATRKLKAECEEAHEASRKRERLEYKQSELNQALLGEDTNDYSELIVDEKERIAKLKRRVGKLRAFVDERKVTVEQLRFWQHGFGAKGLRSLMLDSCLPFLNAKLDAYTNALTAGNIEVEFKTQRELKGGGVREDFHIEVRNKHGSTRYNMNSIGERAKIDIIVGLALQDMAASRSKVPVNVAFFDEVFDGLDDRGIDRAVQVLSQLRRESAFIISHKSELKTFFSKRLVVIKENGESRLEQA